MPSILPQFRKDERGAVAATYGIALLGLIAIAGVGYDVARLYGMDSELQNGADQAALAAATQLDKKDGACARAASAAVGLVQNITLLSNDGNGNQVQVNGGAAPAISNDDCGDKGWITFFSEYTDASNNTVANSDEDARFVFVSIDARTARYALTPVVGAFAGTSDAGAIAGLGSAICRVPPLMICSPNDDGSDFDAAANRGMGIQATGQGGASWAPGDFGFLEVGAGQLGELAQALAYDQTDFDCAPIDGGTDPETGNAQVLYQAINTRFDINPISGGASLSLCDSGNCPPAANVTKDLIKTSNGTNGNACSISNAGWKLPPVGERFRPRGAMAGDGGLTQYDADGLVTAMGLTRDLCHYYSYNDLNGDGTPDRTCASVNGGRNSKFGNGQWAIGDYFARNHPGVSAPSSSMTRYEVYLWEQGLFGMGGALPAALNGQNASPICMSGASTIDRRVLTVAVVKNCAALRGGSTEVEVDEWVDMFLVEPIVDDPNEIANGRLRDQVYMEVIGPSFVGDGSGAASTQAIRRDVPYLLE